MRLSILLLYLTLFQQKGFRNFGWGMGAFIVLFPVASMLSLFGFCQPISKNWNKLEPGHCGNTFAVEIVSGAINLILDWLLILMPMPIVWRLQMPTKKKITVTSIFSLGIMSVHGTKFPTYQGISVLTGCYPLLTILKNYRYQRRSHCPADCHELRGLHLLHSRCYHPSRRRTSNRYPGGLHPNPRSCVLPSALPF